MGRKNLGSKTIRLTKQQRFIIQTCIEQYKHLSKDMPEGWGDDITKIMSKIKGV